MINSIIPFLFLCGILFGACLVSSCNPIEESNTKPLDQHQTTWSEYLNKHIDSLGNTYVANALSINPDGTIRAGHAAIIKQYDSLVWHIDSIKWSSKIIANKDSTYEYAVGTFWTSSSETYKLLVINHLNEGHEKIELEFVAKAKDGPSMLKAITDRRNAWIDLCNQHDAQQLVDSLYAKNAIYYNHRPVVIGRETIGQTYQYMNDERYQLTLTPIQVEAVNDSLVYEIGQCSGSYGGKYVIIWQLGRDGVWRVLLDSNI